MSIFGDIWDRVTGANEAQTQALAQNLDRWIAIRRRWKQDSATFDRVAESVAGIASKLPDSDPLVAGWYNLQEAFALQWDQIQAHDATILGYISRAVEAGKLDRSAAAEYKRRLDEAVGLGALPVPVVYAIAVAILAVGGAIVNTIVDQSNAKIDRDNKTHAAALLQWTRLADARRNAAPTSDLPPLPETPSGPIESAVGSSIKGVGVAAVLAVVGIAGVIGYNATRKGKR